MKVERKALDLPNSRDATVTSHELTALRIIKRINPSDTDAKLMNAGLFPEWFSRGLDGLAASQLFQHADTGNDAEIAGIPTSAGLQLLEAWPNGFTGMPAMVKIGGCDVAVRFTDLGEPSNAEELLRALQSS